MSGRLQGRTALITGASKGLGKAMAEALASEGAGIALVSRSQTDLERAAETIGPLAKVFVADVSEESEVLRLEKQVIGAFGRVDILINNAGINNRKYLTEFTVEEWKRVMDTNVTSTFLICRSFIQHMKGTGYGRIINMTSTLARVALPKRTAYCASKAAVLGLTRALALELAPNGITVNGISPGPFATEMNRVVFENPEANADFIARIPLGRWGRMEEIGKLAVYLCSDEAGFITGTDILIDGGWCAQ
jgi:NAD(P)-dependent dehydrogenase (short-subunit alcohol dehydrogenase family)